MKDKIFGALKTKYSNLGLSDKALNGIAELLAITTSEETEIDNAISTDGVVNALKGIQHEADARVAASKPKKLYNKSAEQLSKGQQEQKEQEEEEEAPPKWAMKMLNELESLKKDKVSQTRVEQFKTRLKDAPAEYVEKELRKFNRMKDSLSEDELEEVLSEYEEEAKTYVQASADSKLASQRAPIIGNKVPIDTKQATNEEIEDAVKALKI